VVGEFLAKITIKSPGKILGLAVIGGNRRELARVGGFHIGSLSAVGEFWTG
jgi:hypothetical protein